MNQLVVKEYLSQTLKDLSNEQAAYAMYLKQHEQGSNHAQKFLESNSLFSEIISEYYLPTSEEIKQWISEPYDSNPKYPEQLIHKTYNGDFVRSKSESFIHIALTENHIPFRYEAALQLGKKTIYPDFTIRHPVTGVLYYWEHFGMIDNPEYLEKMLAKLRLYISNNIIPSANLIVTFETGERPLDPEYVNHIIEHYFK